MAADPTLPLWGIFLPRLVRLPLVLGELVVPHEEICLLWLFDSERLTAPRSGEWTVPPIMFVRRFSNVNRGNTFGVRTRKYAREPP
ncbi:hypothetical protein IU479_10150 [Nocardia abscessus]|uniref:hypothetical protein n=1 Tax=Nocardia abscessus TaxID=120957 RepID=UPI0018949038|nr:hypothetical protein [Nocardia abscessus]MBF6218467.1 hypothetical protein [Nocardia abscessus]